MNGKIFGICICMLLIFSALLPLVETTKIEIKKEKSINYIQGEIIVKFKAGVNLELSVQNNLVITGIDSIDNLNIKYKVHEIQLAILGNLIPKNMELIKKIGLDRIYTFHIDNEVNILEACEKYNDNPKVEYAELSYFGQGCLTPNDTNFNLQYGLHNTGQTGGSVDADIDAPEGWNIETGEQGVKIAIIDSGIEYTHSDISSRIWINYGDPINGIDDDSNGFTDDYRGWDFVNNDNDPNDDHTNSHGTHCAGIAGAATNNNLGVAGVDWNCKLMAIKSMKYNNIILWVDAAAGLTYAADMGADIISMSWSGSTPSQTLKDGIDYAYGAGCVLVAASGNYGTSFPYIPASYGNTIAVGATDHYDERWSSSNYGSHLDLVAPGVDIYSTKRSNNYGYITGTSMSTPMVAGAAALLKAQDHTYTQTIIRNILTMTADDEVGDPSEDTPGFDIYHGHGRLNIYSAMYGAPLKPSKPSGPLTGKVGQLLTYTTIAYDPNDDNLYYQWDWGDSSPSVWDGPYPSGQQVSGQHTWSQNGNFNIKVKVKDIDNKESDWSDILQVSITKSKTINIPLFRFLQKYSNLIELLQGLFSI
jgi:subtilisin family serine protease